MLLYEILAKEGLRTFVLRNFRIFEEPAKPYFHLARSLTQIEKYHTNSKLQKVRRYILGSMQKFFPLVSRHSAHIKESTHKWIKLCKSFDLNTACNRPSSFNLLPRFFLSSKERTKFEVSNAFRVEYCHLKVLI